LEFQFYNAFLENTGFHAAIIPEMDFQDNLSATGLDCEISAENNNE
jgi:hypothetical protein